MSTNIEDSINQALNSIRPAIQGDGGDVEFVKFEDGTVYVRLTGNCVGCPLSTLTLSLGIEETLISRIPQVSRVVLVED